MNIKYYTSLPSLLYIALVLALYPVTSIAGDRFSVFAGINNSTADNIFIGGRSLNTEPPPTLDPDGSFSGTSVRLSATYLWRDWAGVEFGWSRFGKEDRFTSHFIDFVCPGVCPPGEGVSISNVKQNGKAYWMVLRPTLVHGNWHVFGKIGPARTTIESQRLDPPPPFFVQNERKETKTALLMGAGSAYYFSKNVGVQIDVERLGSRAHQFGGGITIRF